MIKTESITIKNEIIKNEAIENMFIKNKDETIRNHVVSHCRTKRNIKMTTFIWSITNFWDTYNFFNTLTFSKIEGLPFRLQMCIDKKEDKLSFFIYTTDNESVAKIKIQRYKVAIDDIMGTNMVSEWKEFPSNTYLLSVLYLKTFRINKSTYLLNNTLSLRFAFESCEIIHNISYANILGRQQITVMNNFTCDDSNITFKINEQNVSVSKSLLIRANSTFFINAVKQYKTNKKEPKEIQLHNIAYDTFKFIISYLKSNGLMDLRLNENETKEVYINRLRILLKVASEFDIKNLKVLCEKRLKEYTIKNNVVQHLQNAIITKAIYLETYAKKLIKLHIDDIINTTAFIEMIENNPKILTEILKQDLFKEDVLFSKSN